MYQKNLLLIKNKPINLKEYNFFSENPIKIQESQNNVNKNVNQSLLNLSEKKNSFQKSNLPIVNNNNLNINEPIMTSPNIHYNSNKNLNKTLYSAFKSNTIKKEKILKHANSINNNINFVSFRANIRKKTKKAKSNINKNNKNINVFLNEGKNYNILEDIKTLNNFEELQNQNSADYNYSLLIKKLDNWDKDHCAKNKMDLFSLHRTLNLYYKSNNLIEEQNNLDTMDNMLQEKLNYYRYKENKTYGILGNKQHKNNIKNKKKENEIKEDNKTNIFNSIIINNLNKSYAKNKIDFNIKLMKERLDYEHQLHKELIFVNNIIYNKKYIKKDKIKEINIFYSELDKLNSEYEKRTENFKKKYYYLLEELSNEYTILLSDKLKEMKLIQEGQKVINISAKKSLRKKSKKDVVNEIKDIEFKKKTKIAAINNEMKNGLDIIKGEYDEKYRELYIKKENLENELTMISSELNYYKSINEELLREHQLYYLDILKKGKDCRKDGLVWVVKNLCELKINLEYHHFPKYLTHEQIDYLKKLAYLILEENELKIILKILKKKQKDDRENAKIEYMNFFDTITKGENNKGKKERNNNNSIKRQIRSYDEEMLKIKRKIDKKFLKIYKNNEEALKIYLAKSLEDEKMQNIIYYLKRALYSNNDTSFVKENKISIIEAFLGKTKNKDLFSLILNITKRLQEIDENKKSMINKEKEYYLERIKNINGNTNQNLDYVYNKELIKNCLFGERIYY